MIRTLMRDFSSMQNARNNITKNNTKHDNRYMQKKDKHYRKFMKNNDKTDVHKMNRIKLVPDMDKIYYEFDYFLTNLSLYREQLISIRFFASS